jgi:histidinol dehydrogenase
MFTFDNEFHIRHVLGLTLQNAMEPRMAKPVNFHELAKLSSQERAALLQRAETDLAPFIEKVIPIIAAVRKDGDEALARFARDFDKSPVPANQIAATEEDFAAAEKTLDPKVHDALKFANESIRKFHQAQKPEEMWLHEMRPGAFAGERTNAIPSVACYVPRGKGSFPSAVLMTTIPANVAGVKNIIITTPPGPDGKIDDASLVAAKMGGVSRVYKAGGAQAIAAAAYGTATVPKVSKIIGPGSPWVAAAKRLVSHMVDTGTPAGPSEAIVMADDTVDGKLAALDLLIESEHGPDGSAYLITWSRRVAEEAIAALPSLWAEMSAQRVDYSSTVLSGPIGGVILARDENEAIAFINEYAPEHLQILSKDPFSYLGRIENAGEILLGEYTPSTLGNFVLGPNHVLPTSGWARTGSGLSVHDFMKRITVGYVTETGYRTLAPHAQVFAKYEGFDGHGNAVSNLRDTILRKNS